MVYANPENLSNKEDPKTDILGMEKKQDLSKLGVWEAWGGKGSWGKMYISIKTRLKKRKCSLCTVILICNHKEEHSRLICKKMDITGDDHVKLIKSISESQVSCFLSFVAPRF